MPATLARFGLPGGGPGGLLSFAPDDEPLSRPGGGPGGLPTKELRLGPREACGEGAAGGGGGVLDALVCFAGEARGLLEGGLTPVGAGGAVEALALGAALALPGGFSFAGDELGLTGGGPRGLPLLGAWS